MTSTSSPLYMKIIEQISYDMAITESISVEAIALKKKTFDIINDIKKLTMPVYIQLFGSNTEILSKAAQTIVKYYPVAFININMSCPVVKFYCI